MKEIIRIIKYSWDLKPYYLWTALLVVIVSLLNQATPFFLKSIVDGLTAILKGGSVPLTYFGLFLLLILIVNVAITLISNIQGYIGDRLAAKLNTLLSQRYYDHILSLPLSYFDNQISGKVTSQLERSIVTISNLMNAFANNFVGFFLTTLLTLAILAFYAWPVALLLALLFPLYIWLTTLSSRSWLKKQDPINAATDTAQGRFVETIAQIRAVKSYVAEKTESRFFAEKRSHIENRTRDQSVEWHWYDIARRLGLNLIFFGIYCYIILEAYHGRYSLGEVTLLLQLVTQAQFPLFASSFIVDNIQRAASGSRDFFAAIHTTPAIQDQPKATSLKLEHGRIEYRHVNFGYTADQPILTDITCTIEPGSKVALIGESGEGKSTLASLLCRFYQPTSGHIFIDDHDICIVTQTSLRRQIAVVFQEPTLFSGTIHDNIAYGKPSATNAEIKAAATAAHAADFIAKLPQGYQTEIGERGVKLSGGQKQRLSIARALLKNAPILILDEATSSLDARSEREVQLALDTLMQGRTTIIIAHRLSTIASVDRIISLRGGRIAEIGTPAELSQQPDSLYAELLTLQTSGITDTKAFQRFDLAPSQSSIH